MLLKNPPISMIFYNSAGRTLNLFFNFISILLFNKFIEKETYIERNKSLSNKNFGKDNSIWPPQNLDKFEKIKEVEDNFFNILQQDYDMSISQIKNKPLFKDSPWWIDCRKEFQNIFISDNKKFNKEEFKTFRNNKKTKAALLADQNFLIGDENGRALKFKSLSLIHLYHKLSEFMDENILRAASDSLSGENICLNYRGQRLNHRVLRHAYYLSQVYHNTDLKNKKDLVFLDLGGGYGGLTRFLHNYFTKATSIVIELPEVCALASYFLKNIFPEKKIGTLKDFIGLDLIKKNDLLKFDFVILPQTMIEKIENDCIDLSINTTSMGEMTNEMQNFYLSQIERITSSYFYSVNRAKQRLDKFNAQGFYNLQFKKRWQSLIYKYTHTYHIEFLGKKKND